MSEFEKRYQEYLERHDGYYPDRPRMSFEEFKVWDGVWDKEYLSLWNDLNKVWDGVWDKEYLSLWNDLNHYLNQHGLILEFAAAPQWPRIKELEERLCV